MENKMKDPETKTMLNQEGEQGKIPKWAAFLQLFSNPWPLKVLYNIA